MKFGTRLSKCIILDHKSVKEDKLANFFQVKDMRFSTWEIPGLSRLTQTYPNIFEDFQKHSKDVQKDAPNILPLLVTRKRPRNGQLSFNNPPALCGTSDNQLPVLDPASLPRSPLSPASSSACDPTLWYTGHTEAEEPACWISTCWYSGIAVKTLEWLELHSLCNGVTKTWQMSEYTEYRTQWVFHCRDVAVHLKRAQSFV